MKPKRGILCAIAAIIAILFTCWMGGYNFDHRGEGCAFMTIITILAAGTAFVAGANDWKDCI